MKNSDRSSLPLLKKQRSHILFILSQPRTGRTTAFLEWYATRHIRHALNILALVSGQCFERTLFQMPGALEAKFQTIAIYEQAGTPEDILESFASIPSSTFDFPALDTTRFSDWVYRPI